MRPAFIHRWLVLVLVLSLALSGCAPRSTPAPLASATPPPGPDRWLATFDAPSGQVEVPGPVHCDGHEGATLDCQVVDGYLSLSLDGVGGNAYAAWWTELTGEAGDLSDFQALTLRLRRDGGGLVPHLYLNDRDGVRAYVDLLRFVLPAGDDEDQSETAWQDVTVPLRWFQDGQGRRPDLSRVVELQVVFEWQQMAGTVDVDDLSLVHHVQRPLDMDVGVPAGVGLPPGFQASVYSTGGRLTGATAITWDPDGNLWLAQQQGEIWRLEDQDGDGRADTASLFASGFPILVGLLWNPDGDTLYASNRGSITALSDQDGDGRADNYQVLVDDLPFSRHHNNGLAWGPDGKLYFGLGSGADVGQEGDPWFATILRMPPDGGREDIEVVARGLRNAYDVAFNRAGQLFAGENGPDEVAGPDELNHIVQGQHYGYPQAFGYDDGGGQYRVPVWTFADHSSADGLTVYEADQFPQDYQDSVFIALFGNLFGDSVAGHEVDRVVLSPSGDTFTGQGAPFMTGLDRPLDVTVGPDGSLYVLEYLAGTVYRVTWQGAASG